MFFLSGGGVTYERTHTLDMSVMGGMARKMPTTFAFFTAASMASLALPGMSGFVSEIAVFLGMATSDAYSPAFKIIIVIAAAIGVVLSPIYLLSMLRRVFYGDTGEVVAKIPAMLDYSAPGSVHCVLPAGTDHWHWPVSEAGNPGFMISKLLKSLVVFRIRCWWRNSPLPSTLRF